MKKVYCLRSKTILNDYPVFSTPWIFTSRSTAEAWRKHLQAKTRTEEYFIYEDYIVKYKPIE